MPTRRYSSFEYNPSYPDNDRAIDKYLAQWTDAGWTLEHMAESQRAVVRGPYVEEVVIRQAFVWIKDE
jgi:hypothetical protein